MADNEKQAQARPGGDTKSSSKERSPNYPATTLTEAIELVQKFWEKERRTTVDPESAAKALGYATLSGASRVALAALKQYGLIESNGNGLRVSPNAMDILFATKGSDEYLTALKAAALNPPLISELAPTHSEASDDTLRAYLITRKRFSPDGANRFIEAFRDAVRVIGPEDPGYIEEASGVTGGQYAAKPAAPVAPKPPTVRLGDIVQFTFPLSTEVSATLTSTGPLGANELAALEKYFNIWKEMFVAPPQAAAITPSSPAPEVPGNGEES